MAGSVSAQVFLHGSCEDEQQTGDEANYIVQLPVPVNLDTTKTLLLTEPGIILQSIQSSCRSCTSFKLLPEGGTQEFFFKSALNVGS